MTLKNEGHGHVFPRPDGAKARCGGTLLCSECQKDLRIKSDYDKLVYKSTEWVAIYSIPTSRIDSYGNLVVGYHELETKPYPSKEEAKSAALYRSEETLAKIVRYECRDVFVSSWMPLTD